MQQASSLSRLHSQLRAGTTSKSDVIVVLKGPCLGPRRTRLVLAADQEGESAPLLQGLMSVCLQRLLSYLQFFDAAGMLFVSEHGDRLFLHQLVLAPQPHMQELKSFASPPLQLASWQGVYGMAAWWAPDSSNVVLAYHYGSVPLAEQVSCSKPPNQQQVCASCMHEAARSTQHPVFRT